MWLNSEQNQKLLDALHQGELHARVLHSAEIPMRGVEAKREPGSEMWRMGTRVLAQDRDLAWTAQALRTSYPPRNGSLINSALTVSLACSQSWNKCPMLQSLCDLSRVENMSLLLGSHQADPTVADCMGSDP